QRVEKLDTLQRRQQPRTAAPTATVSPFEMSGLRCPHRAARLGRRLHSATAAPAPPRCIRRRRRSAPQPSTKFCGESRTRHFVPRTQFAAKFPCWCRRRRRMSADGDGFYTFSKSEARTHRRPGFFVAAPCETCHKKAAQVQEIWHNDSWKIPAQVLQ